MAIEVFFSGLMLICLDGQLHCPVGESGGNRAWVVNADGQSKPCGWNSPEVTKLDLQFPTDKFDESASTGLCKQDADKTMTVCELPARRICVVPSPRSMKQVLEKSLNLIPRLDEVDPRFEALDMKRLQDPHYVSAQIDFPDGVIGSGIPWPKNGKQILWYRSNGQEGAGLPRPLSDRVKVTYEEASELEITNCENNQPLVKLRSRATKAEVMFRNHVDGNLIPDIMNGHDNLAYLLWYYELASWKTENHRCPQYSQHKRDAVLLSCARVKDSYCACKDSVCARDESEWPPDLVGEPVTPKR
jgi:hypothetical protein